MQPVQSPEEYMIQWLYGMGLVGETPPAPIDKAAIMEARRLLQEKMMNRPILSSDPFPTLLSVLQEMGRLTPEQRAEGESTTGRQRAEFMNWRAQTMAEELRRRQNPPGSPEQR